MATHSGISCLENPMDRGAWWATVHGVSKSQTQLSMHTHTHTQFLSKKMRGVLLTDTSRDWGIWQISLWYKNTWPWIRLGVAAHICSQAHPGPALMLCLWTYSLQPGNTFLCSGKKHTRTHIHTLRPHTPGAVIRVAGERSECRAFKKHKPQALVWVYISASSVSSAAFAHCFEPWLLQLLLPLKFWSILSMASSSTVSGRARLTSRHIFEFVFFSRISGSPYLFLWVIPWYARVIFHWFRHLNANTQGAISKQV